MKQLLSVGVIVTMLSASAFAATTTEGAGDTAVSFVRALYMGDVKDLDHLIPEEDHGWKDEMWTPWHRERLAALLRNAPPDFQFHVIDKVVGEHDALVTVPRLVPDVMKMTENQKSRWFVQQEAIDVPTKALTQDIYLVRKDGEWYVPRYWSAISTINRIGSEPALPTYHAPFEPSVDLMLMGTAKLARIRAIQSPQATFHTPVDDYKKTWSEHLVRRLMPMADMMRMTARSTAGQVAREKGRDAARKLLEKGIRAVQGLRDAPETNAEQDKVIDAWLAEMNKVNASL